MNENLIFRDENGNFFSTSRVSRREREFFYSNLVFREGDENLKITSQGRARKNEPNSHENSRDREFSLCSEVRPPDGQVWNKCIQTNYETLPEAEQIQDIESGTGIIFLTDIHLRLF